MDDATLSIREMAEAMPHMVWAARPNGIVDFVNRAGLELLGNAPSNGRDLWRAALHPEDRERFDEMQAQAAAEGRPYQLECRVKHRDEANYHWFLARVSPIRDGVGGIVRWLGSCAEIDEQKRLEKRLTLQGSIGRILAEADSIEAGSREILQAISETADLDTGGLWLLDRRSNQLKCTQQWQRPGLELREFAQESKNLVFEKGAGLPGRVWEGDSPVLIHDLLKDKNFPRNKVAAKEGLQAALGFPVRGERQVLGVLEFFSTGAIAPDEKFLQMLEGIGRQIGQFLERKEAECGLMEHARRLEILNRVSGVLVAERSLEKIVQAVTDGSREISGAEFGAFFYNPGGKEGKSYVLHTLSGLARERLAGPPTDPRAVFSPVFRSERAMRLADVSEDSRYEKTALYFGIRVRSYLAVPVVSQSAQTLGVLVFGHPLPGMFGEESEQMIVMLGAETAIAIDNAKLYEAAQRDLEHRRRADEASRRLATIVETSDDAILSKDLNGVIQTWNAGAQRIFGYTAEEVIGKPVTVLIPADRFDEEPEILRRLRAGERIEHYETVRQRKDGALINVSLTVSPLKNEEGKIVGASKIARDITEKKRSEKALREATERLAKVNEELEIRVQQRTASLREAIHQMEEFSYTVSHDLRAPLRAMHSYSEALLEDFSKGLPEQARHFLRRINENAIRLDKMILDVLTVSRLNRADLRLTRVPLEWLVRNLVEHYPNMQPPQVEIQIDPLLDVIGHEPSLTQAISNLLSNAVKFVPRGRIPKVHVWTEQRGEQVRLWVEDNGIGIDPKYQHRLFGMFERIHPNLHYEGTGVGLAIVRKAAERMGGSVGVESAPEKGSKFWIDLPAPQKEE